MNKKNIWVYADWIGLSQPTLIGTLHVIPSRGKEIFSFEYHADWLNNHATHTIDPALQLFHGMQYPTQNQENFGVFLDSSPDRWGRFLMHRREAQQARNENRKEKTLLASDYLLGVYDEYRMGALRFKTEKNGPFLDNNKSIAAPPWTELRAIESACLAIEKKDAEKKSHYQQWLNMLIAPGGSLGGARPKACVLDKSQHAWIAKFPRKTDEYDIGAWEMLIHRLAHKAKIIVPDAKITKFNSLHHTFLSKRFDRNKIKRIHFASAMTLLHRHDGDDASTGASYLELVEFILRMGSRVEHDLEQLWRRIVFNICVSNVDDHLRNHGFIFDPASGWFLSPAFDMNAVSDGNGLKLNISETDNSQDLTLAKSVSNIFKISPNKADSIVHDVIASIKTWRKEAMHLRISLHQQDLMQNAFRIIT
ncbi:MAG: toxin HipA [Gammaproteobacteria bacterium RIFCSPHIGHO2_12_FULL_38_11]|nr:MAG: toxin HipA [Gammaproteobacteria bacterium RIFCSPHIGHO2_12_FULL_38_11]